MITWISGIYFILIGQSFCCQTEWQTSATSVIFEQMIIVTRFSTIIVSQTNDSYESVLFIQCSLIPEQTPLFIAYFFYSIPNRSNDS